MSDVYVVKKGDLYWVRPSFLQPDGVFSPHQRDAHRFDRGDTCELPEDQRMVTLIERREIRRRNRFAAQVLRDLVGARTCPARVPVTEILDKADELALDLPF